MGQADCRFDYEGSRVLVTGGSNGIGAGIAAAFRAAGATAFWLTGAAFRAVGTALGVTGVASGWLFG